MAEEIVGGDEDIGPIAQLYVAAKEGCQWDEEQEAPFVGYAE